MELVKYLTFTLNRYCTFFSGISKKIVFRWYFKYSLSTRAPFLAGGGEERVYTGRFKLDRAGL